jgi:hypothetical protein
LLDIRGRDTTAVLQRRKALPKNLQDKKKDKKKDEEKHE